MRTQDMTVIPAPEQKEVLSFEELAREAEVRFASMSPEDQEAHRGAQRRSWVVGEMMLAHPEMTRSQAEALYSSLGT